MLPRMKYEEFKEHIRLAAEMTTIISAELKLPPNYSNIIFSQTLSLLFDNRLTGTLPPEYYTSEESFEIRLINYIKDKKNNVESIDILRVYEDILRFIQIG